MVGGQLLRSPAKFNLQQNRCQLLRTFEEKGYPGTSTVYTSEHRGSWSCDEQKKRQVNGNK